MNYLTNLIRQNNLLPADAVILRKKIFGMVDHFAVFLGYNNFGHPLFAANYTAGTKLISQKELLNFMQMLEPQSVQKFKGTERERQSAIRRALSKLDEDEYDYFKNNCEHYANYVQHGKAHSPQVEGFKEAVKIVGGITLGAAIFTGLLSLLADE